METIKKNLLAILFLLAIAYVSNSDFEVYSLECEA
jgi:hypothetical protein